MQHLSLLRFGLWLAWVALLSTRPSGAAVSGAAAPGPFDLQTSPSRPPAEANVQWRYIFESPEPMLECPAAEDNNWQGHLLFDFDEDNTSELEDDPTPIPAALARFCVYENSMPSPAAPVLGVAGSLYSDRLVVVPLAAPDDLAYAMGPWLEQRFKRRVGVVRWPEPVGGSKPRLTLIDTTPTLPTAPPQHPSTAHHGDTLSLIAHRMLCHADEGCVANLSTQLALPYVEFDRTTGMLSERYDKQGGALGTLTDVAVAIKLEIKAWEAQSDPSNLVLNLSVGWDPRFCTHEPLDSSVPRARACDPSRAEVLPAVRAVYAALRDASCRGALIVAAAGNRTGGPDDDAAGAFLPAAWEALPAPDHAECANLLSSDASQPPRPALPSRASKASSPHYQPLVYAVAAIGPEHRLLPSARAGSSPPRVAFGDHAVARRGSASPTTTLTGSSVAALVTSVNAAAIWRYRPALSAAEVMTILGQSGEAIQASPGLMLEPELRCEDCLNPPTEVRRIDACAALHTACAPTTEGLEGACPAAELPTCPPSALVALSISLPSAEETTIDLETFTAVTPTPPACGNQTVFVDPDLTQFPDPILCPAAQYDSLHATPFVGPQPEEKPCPACAADCCSSPNQLALDIGLAPTKTGASATLYIEIPDDAPSLCAPTLTIANQIYRVAEQHWPCLEPGDQCEITIKSFPIQGGPVNISFAVVEAGSSCDAPGIPRWSLSNDLVNGS